MTQHYDEFYDDVHTEFLKFGELINFKVCKNGSSHLRGNVYVHYQSLDSAVAAFNAINGRFFAGKQVVCEFVAITRWKMAICGEYMKSRHKSCSHGNACNFLHCFRNPGGEYDWGDWDSPPPRSWLIKMDMLFGGSRVDRHDYRKPREQDNWHHYGHFDRRIQSRSSCKSSSRRHKSRERDSWSSDDSGGTSIRDHSGSSKYNSEEEREKRSYLDQPWDTYNMRPNQRNCSHSRGGSEKPKRGDKDICEDRKNMDRHYHINDSSLYRIKRKRRQREHTSEDDNDDKERSAVGVDKDHAGEKQSKRRRESCIQSEGEDNKSNDRETIEGEDFGSSHHEKERKGRASRRPQDQLDSANIDREKIKSSKRGHRRSQSPRKHKDHRKGPKRHRYSKSPRRSINLSRRRDRGKSVSPNRGQYSNRLPSRSRDLCETPKRSSAEGSFDSLDRWQASNDTEL